MNTNVLIDKKIVLETPKNWRDWLNLWNETSNPLILISLIECGYQMKRDTFSDQLFEVDKLYLQIANRSIFHHRSSRNQDLENVENELAQHAFKVLLDYRFSSKYAPVSCSTYVDREELLVELLDMTGVSDSKIDSKQEFIDGIRHGTWLGNNLNEWEKIQWRNFCLNIAKSIIVESESSQQFAPSHTLVGEIDRKHSEILRTHLKSIIRLLFGMKELSNIP